MEFIERLPLKPIQWLSQLSFQEFSKICPTKSKEECKTKYTTIMQFCKTNLKTDGITKRIYSHANEVEGRLFSGNSIQGLPCKIRGLLMRDGIATDIDMSNAHPVILRYICKIHNIQCPNLEYYIHNREECLSHFETREQGKISYLTSLNKDSISRKKELPKQFKLFDAEIKRIQKKLLAITDFHKFVESVPRSKTYNRFGSAVNRIICYYENKILQHAISFLTGKNIEIAVLMFDGLMIYGDYYHDTELLDALNHFVEKKMEGLEMKWCYKEHNMDLCIPHDFEFEKENKNGSKSFEVMAEEFEKTHLKIINKSHFVKHNESNVIFLTLGQLKMSYSHLSYDIPKYNSEGAFIGYKSKPFIPKWTSHTHAIRHKEDIDVYPNPAKCPDNIFNLWTPFAMEQMTGEYEWKQKELDAFLNLIKILCNHQEHIYDYFVKWIAQMIQYPEVKTIMPTFISKEGAGKGTLVKLFEHMLGKEKVFESTNPNRDVWGDFNGIMKSCFLVNLNEISKKHTFDAEGQIKGLITDYYLTINQKGVQQYQIKSFHRFIGTTNVDEPFKTTKADRRNLIIRSSDEKKGDSQYFDTLHGYLDDVNVIRTCYDYFKSIPDMDQFGKIPLPQTEYQANLKELSRSPIEQWLESFVRENSEQEEVELYGNEIYNLFEEWRIRNGIKYEIHSLKLGVRLTNMKINGIHKGSHTKKGKTKKFIIDELKKSLGIGCLIGDQ
jgi:hypothetical protein